jgi:chromosome segregation ATPase
LPWCAACASGGGSAPESAPVAAKEEGRRKVGPSLAYEEDDGRKNNSLLVRTEKQDLEIASLNERLTKTERERDAAGEETRRAKDEIRNVVRERDELRRLLDEALAKERGLVEQAASAEIERLRTERRLVECQLAMLVREAK